MLVFARHAEPRIDPGVAPNRWRLSARGRSQAAGLAGSVRRLAPRRCYASPEPKALETAEILCAPVRIPVIPWEGLEEHDRAGVPFFAEAGAFEAAVADALREPHRVVLGRESAAQARDRFGAAVERACRESPDDLLFVSHGTVLALFLAAALERDALEVWRELGFAALAAIQWPRSRLVEWQAGG